MAAVSKRHTLGLLVITHAAALGAGYYYASKEPVDAEVKSTGYFTVDTTKVLATTVESLRTENRLLVFSYKVTAKVHSGRRRWWLFRGHQELSVPAVVNYYIDLSGLTLADVSYIDAQKLVTVKLPKVTLGDIAFQPEQATTINGGVLTYDDETVEALRKLNYLNARRAMVAQAQQPGLLGVAKKQAITNVQQYFKIPLRIAGRPDVEVVAKFE